jgi:hypothetical protein
MQQDGTTGREGVDVDGTCAKHQFERSVDLCHSCGDEFCPECLVFPFGRGKTPYCINCALAVSGVRTNAARAPKLSRRELRRRTKEREQAEQARLAAMPVAEVHLGDAIDLDWSAPAPSTWADPASAPRSAHGTRVPF